MDIYLCIYIYISTICLYIYNLLPINSIFFGLLFSRNAKKTDADQSILQAFLIQSQKKRLTNLLK